jgi:acetyl esterase/lipase
VVTRDSRRPAAIGHQPSAILRLGLSLGLALGLVPLSASEYGVTVQAPAAPVTWRLDNLERIGGHAVTVIGEPRVVQTDIGRAIEFKGTTDGLLVEANPIEGLSQFTIDVVFQPFADGPEEQRFLHIQEAQTENRALVELRMVPERRWALDTYLHSGKAGLTLLDRAITHPTDRWHVATLTYDGKTMTHYVDGVRELSGETTFVPLRGGRTSLGVRQNRVSWFKGRIHSIRVASHARPSVLPLWPEGTPGAKGDGGEERLVDGRVYNVHNPTLTYVPPTGTPDGTSVIVCPGGAFARLAIANEAAGVAGRMQPVGVATFVLKYRLAEYGHPAPLQDVLRAIRTLRARAGEFGLRPDRIGVIGASAGGHVAASAATLFDAPEGRTGHALDTISARPDFVALLYPVITMRLPLAHAASRRHLLGEKPAPSIVDRLSLERQVTQHTPPVFLVHTAEDESVPVDHTLLFYDALRRAGVPAEMHIYARGPHGFGTRTDLGTTSGWVDRLLEWMRARGFARGGEAERP